MTLLTHEHLLKYIELRTLGKKTGQTLIGPIWLEPNKVPRIRSGGLTGPLEIIGESELADLIDFLYKEHIEAINFIREETRIQPASVTVKLEKLRAKYTR